MECNLTKCSRREGFIVQGKGKLVHCRVFWKYRTLSTILKAKSSDPPTRSGLWYYSLIQGVIIKPHTHNVSSNRNQQALSHNTYLCYFSLSLTLKTVVLLPIYSMDCITFLIQFLILKESYLQKNVKVGKTRSDT